MHYTFRTRPRGVPWWFWGIVLFQCRVLLWGGTGFITHEPERLLLSGNSPLSDWVSMMSGLPALLMVILYAFEVTSGGLRGAALILMVFASLADIVMHGHTLTAPELPAGDRYLPALVVLLNVACIVALVTRGRLRRTLLPGRDYQ